MAISIEEWSEDTEDLFEVTFFDYKIKTTVTAEPSIVTEWISDIERIHRRRLHHLIVGLDIESSENFLTGEDYTFVGVGIGSDVRKLEEDWDLEVSNWVDLSRLAAERMGMRRNAGLKELAREVLGVEVEKPRNVTLSRWDRQELWYDQIQYACVDAFMSFEIGRRLNAA
ncbi:hypothetical protein Ancab_013937 [Ancistrocladus abbreviatus]